MYPHQIILDKGRIPRALFNRLTNLQQEQQLLLQSQILASLWVAPLSQSATPVWQTLMQAVSQLELTSDYFHRVHDQVERARQYESQLPEWFAALGKLQSMGSWDNSVAPLDQLLPILGQYPFKYGRDRLSLDKNGQLTLRPGQNKLPAGIWSMLLELVFFHYMAILRHQPYLHFQVGIKTRPKNTSIHLGPIQVQLLRETDQLARLFVPFGAMGVCGRNFEIPLLLQLGQMAAGSASLYQRRGGDYLLLDIPHLEIQNQA